MTTIALTRAVSPSISTCQLTHLSRQTIDLEEAQNQHALYERALEACGCEVRRVCSEPDLPDAVFVEDAAVVVDELAVIMRPGAETRRAETPSVEAVLAPFRPVVRIQDPGTIDGGDVLRIGRRLFVGITTRSNPSGINQLREHLAPHGYSVEAVPVSGCLHLKSAITTISDDTVLANPSWVDLQHFGVANIIEVDPTEPSAANIVAFGNQLVHGAEHTKTRKRLEKHGFEVVPVPISELAKAEAAVTCCSLVFTADS